MLGVPALVKLGHMLETLSIRRYSIPQTLLRQPKGLSENPFGADNQQERSSSILAIRNPQRLYAKLHNVWMKR